MSALIHTYKLSSNKILPTGDTKELFFSNNQLTLVSDNTDPGLILYPVDLKNLQNIIIEITITSARATYIQLFFQTKEDTDFSEINSVIAYIKEGHNTVSLQVNSVSLNGSFRIDTGNKPGVFAILSVKVFNAEGSIYHKTLLNLAKLFENKEFKSINNLVRLSYAKFVTHFFNLLLHLKTRSMGNSLLPRHSSATGQYFNTFLSDLDWDVVLTPDSEKLAPKIKIWLNNLKTFFPFFGEQEFYSDTEFKQKNTLIREVGNIYSELRNIRKIHWMEASYKNSVSDYHRYKSLRAIQACFTKLGVADPARPSHNQSKVSPALEKLISNLFSEINFSGINLNAFEKTRVFSNYFGAFVNFSLTASKGSEYYLSAKNALILLACLPENNFAHSEINNAVISLRNQNHQIKTLSEQLRKIEQLITQAAVRAYEKTPEWALGAFEYLKDSPYVPSHHQDTAGDLHQDTQNHL